MRRRAHARGLRYRVDYRPLTSERFKADMVFTRAKVAVFIDGCFWHGCNQHHRPPRANSSYWRSKIAANIARDNIVDAHLAASGWVTLRFWEHDDPAAVVDRIEFTVTSRRGQGDDGRPSIGMS